MINFIWKDAPTGHPQTPVRREISCTSYSNTLSLFRERARVMVRVPNLGTYRIGARVILYGLPFFD
jgi:hypothetical protein